MKLSFSSAVAVVVVACSAPVYAQMSHDHSGRTSVAAPAAGHDHSGQMVAAASASQALADGVVKKIDKAGKRVTVQHGPLPNGMPAMTMAFPLASSLSIDQFRDGQKIRFAVDQVNGTTTIVRVEFAR